VDECKPLSGGRGAAAAPRRRRRCTRRGRAVQLDPTKPTLTAPGAKRLKLKYDDEPLSNFAFSFKLRRYTAARAMWTAVHLGGRPAQDVMVGSKLYTEAGAYTRPLFSST